MNIFLVPYTWTRHFAVPIVTAGAALFAWWLMMVFSVGLSYPLWERGYGALSPMLEGALLFGAVAFAVGFTDVLAEGALRRVAIIWQVFFALVSGAVSGMGAIVAYALYYGAVLGMIRAMLLDWYDLSEGWEHLVDPAFISLRVRIVPWMLAGLACGMGPLVVRRGHKLLDRAQKYFEIDFIPDPPASETGFVYDIVTHVFGGVTAGLWGAAVWHVCGYLIFADLYVASAAGLTTLGFMSGALIWGIPDELYAGWIRLISGERFGARIPIDSEAGVAERFVGHFPRGMDLHLPAEQGVAELHASFLVDEGYRYAVRGLSVHPTEVKRRLERLDLRYDPSRPAPLETTLHMEDRILLTDAEGNATVLEFLLLPKEER